MTRKEKLNSLKDKLEKEGFSVSFATYWKDCCTVDSMLHEKYEDLEKYLNENKLIMLVVDVENE